MCEPVKACAPLVGSVARLAPAGLMFVMVFGATAWAVSAGKIGDVVLAAAATVAVLVAFHLILARVLTAAVRRAAPPVVTHRPASGVPARAGEGPVAVSVTVLDDEAPPNPPRALPNRSALPARPVRVSVTVVPDREPVVRRTRGGRGGAA